MFEAGFVEDAELAFPEAACTFGTIVYNNSSNAIEIGWQDSARTRVAFVRTRIGSAGEWTTPRGVRVGTTLRQLTRLAGKPLTFSGFGWDYSGRMQWMESGRAVELHLQSTMEKLPAKAHGDQVVRSDLPGLDLNKLAVMRVTQVWGEAWEYHDCHY